MKSKRPSWDRYFLDITELVASRATCVRRKVGAIIVKNKRILSTGYNGPLSGLKHCDETGCLRQKMKIPSGKNQELCRGLHAEQNALLFAVSNGGDMKDAVIYSTIQPCVTCAKMIIQAGIRKIVYRGDYPDSLSRAILKEAGVKCVILRARSKEIK